MGWGSRTVTSSVVLILSALVGQSLMPSTLGSEFPERECCDPVYPIPAPGPAGHNSNAGHGVNAPAAYPEYVPLPSPSSTTEIPGVQTKTASTILNCVRARDQCMDNPACSPILEIVPRVCGPEKVACTTPTVMKCQAALKTLQAFPYFFPTCLCREPMQDPDCNAFREYLFDHPCSFVKVKERDPYPMEALPTCDHAIEVCRKRDDCTQLYRSFKTHCRISDGNCKMEDWELCHDAWTKLRLSPMFGCFCPSDNAKCEKIFGEVNHNSCVAPEKAAADFSGLSSSALFSMERPRAVSFSHFSFSPASLFPPPGTHIRRRHEHRARQHEHVPTDLDSSLRPPLPPARTESHHFVDESLSTPVSYQRIPSPGSFTTSHSGSITVQVISAAHASDHDLESQLETPLLGSHAAQIEQQNKPPPFIPSIPVPLPPPRATYGRGEESGGRHNSRFPPGIATISSIRTSYGGERNLVRVPLHTTCYTAMENCKRNSACNTLLQTMLHWCDPIRCREETCMRALQDFYRGVQEKWALEVAFCLCRKKSEHRHDQECHHAQGQLHPVCAQRGDMGISPPSCHSLAETCRAQPDCKARLMVYETSCAVDSVTRKCAGSTAQCRNATIGILGTVLKKTCGCNGTDYTQIYDCLGWQRILWVNPCVVESQRDFHRVRPGANGTTSPRSTSTIAQIPTEPESFSHEGVVLGTDVVSTTFGNHAAAAVDSEATSERTTHHFVVTSRSRNPTIRPQNSNSPHQNHNRDLTSPDVSFSSSTSISSSRGTTTEELTTLMITTTRAPSSSTQAPRYCAVRRPIQPTQHILEGTSRRLYREDKASCSELCTCIYSEPAASCTILTCLEAKHCSQLQPDNKTIVYRHEEPLYQTGRGRCICYEGRFVCEKPSKDSYNLNSGVFLFLGFSNQDESVLKKQTGLDAVNVIDDLRKLIDPHFQHLFVGPGENDAELSELRKLNGNGCRLGLFRREFENLIINATVLEGDLGNYTNRPLMNELLIKEKVKCFPIMEQLRDLVNNHHPAIHNHQLLSILKLARVDENNIPSPNSCQIPHQPMLSLLLFLNVFLQPLIRHLLGGAL